MKCAVFLSLLLSVQTAMVYQSETEGNTVSLHCEHTGIMTWEKGSDKKKSTILTARAGVITKYRRDVEERYGVMDNSKLVIKNVAVSDSGIYYCNGFPVVFLMVNPAPQAGGVSEVEIGLMFGGVGLAALVFLLATVAAVRVMLHQTWLEGWNTGRHTAQFNWSK
ncbi:neural cell adhesion molecule 2-like [Astyanax mexicanus]|uniref:Neural cell adhesion molecule 2-like n=1 Tax=Astyanax mexicanus TaxID=7994 RepID=A0A8T2MDS9_ASTMX|nr:neural cell adhesion molecule 2-like [Astyanax mexicanus]